jgi:NitT/TauT family transport system ATP-binding protein
MINVVRITFRYEKQAPLFQQFSWQVEKGHTWVIIGPSGCGKSTLLYLLAGLQQPEEGTILINGKAVTSPRPQTGLILQDYGLLPWASVRQNVELGLNLRKFYGPDGKHAPIETIPGERKAVVDGWLQRLGITEIGKKFPAQISGGQRQRTAIARTLVLEPDLLLMDEPFASLDTPTREDLQQLVRTLAEEKPLTTVLVTHTIEEALFLGEKILVLRNGTNSSPLVLENGFTGQLSPHNDSAYQQLTARIREELKGSPA